jgi:hypothetical protein
VEAPDERERRVGHLTRATDSDLGSMKASWLTPPELARMIADYDRIVSTTET